MKLKTTLLTAFLLILTPPLLDHLAAQSSPNVPNVGICKESRPPPASGRTCKVETFEQLSTGNKGASLSTATGLQFIHHGNGDLFIQEKGDLDRALTFECYDSYVTLPNTQFNTDFVRFRFSGFGANVLFVAVDSTGKVLDSVSVENTTFDPPQLVRLETNNQTIHRVWMMHYVLTGPEEDKSCDQACLEPYIGTVRFCDSS